ncbi:hypothetical protein L1887_50557 [Cichorium endivia]|nr:hypothetical protein L1887_50557 [Cichorium endivia]
MRGGPCRAAKSCSAGCSEPRKPPRRYRRGQREQRCATIACRRCVQMRTVIWSGASNFAELMTAIVAMLAEIAEPPRCQFRLPRALDSEPGSVELSDVRILLDFLGLNSRGSSAGLGQELSCTMPSGQRVSSVALTNARPQAGDKQVPLEPPSFLMDAIVYPWVPCRFERESKARSRESKRIAHPECRAVLCCRCGRVGVGSVRGWRVAHSPWKKDDFHRSFSAPAALARATQSIRALCRRLPAIFGHAALRPWAAQQCSSVGAAVILLLSAAAAAAAASDARADAGWLGGRLPLRRLLPQHGSGTYDSAASSSSSSPHLNPPTVHVASTSPSHHHHRLSTSSISSTALLLAASLAANSSRRYVESGPPAHTG